MGLDRSQGMRNYLFLLSSEGLADVATDAEQRSKIHTLWMLRTQEKLLPLASIASIAILN